MNINKIDQLEKDIKRLQDAMCDFETRIEVAENTTPKDTKSIKELMIHKDEAEDLLEEKLAKHKYEKMKEGNNNNKDFQTKDNNHTVIRSSYVKAIDN